MTQRACVLADNSALWERHLRKVEEQVSLGSSELSGVAPFSQFAAIKAAFLAGSAWRETRNRGPDRDVDTGAPFPVSSAPPTTAAAADGPAAMESKIEHKAHPADEKSPAKVLGADTDAGM